MDDTDRIDLAHAPGFALGRLAVRPGTRELVRDDGETEVLEPRVMQVLVALARADGAIVTRDELSRWCWEGRVVGEDAINRVISRLRRSAEGIGARSFRVETITKVGYRLLREGQEMPVDQAPAQPLPVAKTRLDRRAVIAGGAVAVAAGTGAAVALGLFRGKPAKAPVPPEVASLMEQAQAAYHQYTPVGNNQAIGLLRRVVEIAPGYADGWGMLGVAYGDAYWGRGSRNDPGMMQRSREAFARATALDPDSVYVELARNMVLPLMGTWLEIQQNCRAALARHPDNDLALSGLGFSLGLVGRWSDAVPSYAHAVEVTPTAGPYRYWLAMTLWSAGRLDEADQVIDEGLRLFPSLGSLWFARFYVDLNSGQYSKAIAQVDDKAGRPVGVAEDQLEGLKRVALALESRVPADVDAALAGWIDLAHHSTGFCEIAIQLACAFGRLDTAFAIADALFFARGFDPGEIQYTASDAKMVRRNDRRTSFLFQPMTAPMRADPRFDRLTEEIGLKRYWHDAGALPDYLRKS